LKVKDDFREMLPRGHFVKKDLKWNNEVYGRVFKDHGGVESSKDLDDSGFTA
jgi:hypothetical protein